MPLPSVSDKQTKARYLARKGSTKKQATNNMTALTGAVEIYQGKLYYNAFERHQLQQPDFGKYGYLQSRQQGRDDDHDHDQDQNQTMQKRKLHLFSIDTELVYWNFHKDFGPLNLGQLFRFCTKLNQKLQDPRLRDRVIVLYSNTSFAKRANAMYLLAAWQVLYMRRSPEDACMPFKSAIFDQSTSKQNSPRSVTQQNYERRVALDPIPPFHDASPCPCTYDLNILDCLRGLVKARANNFFNFDTFDITEYEHFEQVENGDLNWIVQNKFIAFAGPHFTKSISREGCYSLTPQAFIPYFKEKNVGLVVRLNKRMYNEQDFQKEGIKHFERFYTDGSCPTVPMLRTILHAFEQVPDDKAIAVHCKAGLGRTGTCIGAYIMKHYNFTAKEVIGWMRICRPGMVIGPQQHFLEDIEKQMWYEGQVMKMRPTREPTAAWSDHNEKIDVSDIQEQSADDRQEGHLYDQTSEAVQGRAGQADALLLARRSRRT